MRCNAAAASATMLVAALLAASPACAATITVAADGSGMYLTMQEGIDAASPGDTVEVAAGTYTGPQNRDLDFAGDPVTLVAPAGWATTVIDCESSGRAFFFGSGEDTTTLVSGFSIMHATADSGGGAYCRNQSAPKFFDCRFEACSATALGGGLCCHNSSPVVRGCQFVGNGASGTSYPCGGAIACRSGSAPVVSDTSFDSNVAEKTGGAVYCHSSPATFSRCDFVGNNVGTYGYEGAVAELVVSDGTSFAHCEFRENGLSQAAVGVVHASSSDLTVTDCTFIGNTAGTGAGIDFAAGSSGTVSGCTFGDNDSSWSAGAGIHCSSSSEPTISGCSFVRNRDWHIYLTNSSPTIEYCILAFTTHLGAVCCSQGTETPEIHHCFVYGNAGGDSLCGGNHHDIVYEDPRLCDVTAGDYALCADSPCLPGVTWPSLVGANGQGCEACGSAVEPATWGSIKGLFR
jgi:parallel beta-helix repeat protein/predicted outer membrane repeat protein